jgi:hypothetical protein
MDIADRSGAADGVDEAQVGVTVPASGFNTSELPDGQLLDTLPPLESMLAFKSLDSHQLKGREIMYKFPKDGWYRGRILKPATDGTVKDNTRICNCMVFFEADDELVNRPLYTQNYSTKAVGADGSWALLARNITGALQLETAATAPAPVLALM